MILEASEDGSAARDCLKASPGTCSTVTILSDSAGYDKLLSRTLGASAACGAGEQEQMKACALFHKTDLTRLRARPLVWLWVAPTCPLTGE
jgi:hypothetical protein